MKAGENGEESYNIRKLNFTDKTTFRNTIRKPSCPLIARSGFFKLFSTPWRGWREGPPSLTLIQALCRSGVMQRFKKGEGHSVEIGVCVCVQYTVAVHSTQLLCTHTTQHSREVWRHAPPPPPQENSEI